MKYTKLVFLAAGILLLGLIIRNVNLDEIVFWIARLGLQGLIIVLVIYALAFLCDVISWQLAFRSLAMNLQWLNRLFLVRLIGEAFNTVIPSASVGGEPLKAVILKNSYQISYRESGASLIIARTVNMLSLILFLGIGFILLLSSPMFTRSYQITAGIGLTIITLGTILFYLVQRFQVISLTGTWLSTTRSGSRVEKLLHIIYDVDRHLLEFYASNHAKFITALGLSWLNWLLGVVEIYVVMTMIGYPLGFMDCWIIETMAQLIRTGTFFIPASIGAQEGIFMLMGAIVTGNPSLGVAVSVIRRIRELIWVAMGLVILWGWFPDSQVKETVANSGSNM